MTFGEVVEIIAERIVVIDGSPVHEIEIATGPTPTIEIAAEGLQGSPGSQGPAGAPGGEPFVYDRAGVPAATWPVEHGLGRHVHVTVLVDGAEVDADVEHSDLNHVTITFAMPTDGIANKSSTRNA